MAEETKKTEKEPAKILMVSSSPHLADGSTSRRVMYEVVIGLLPATGMAIYLFRIQAALVVATCVVTSLLTEWLFNAVRKKGQTIGDGSVIITGLILGLSLPPTFAWWGAALGSIVAVAVSAPMTVCRRCPRAVPPRSAAKRRSPSSGNDMWSSPCSGEAVWAGSFALGIT